MLSVPHLIVIFLVLLVVFGPEKLPELARKLGKVMGEFRKASVGLRGNFEEHMRQLENEVREAERTARVEAGARAESPAPAATVSSSSPSALTEPQPEEKPADGNPPTV